VAAGDDAHGPTDDEDDADVAPPPRAPRATPFGSVWDSQLGTPATSSAVPRAPLVDEEDFDEPEIPEYLIAEQRRSGRGGSGGGRGARGGRSAYQSAMERERYGRGGGGGGINRYPDVSGRPRQSPPPREDRGRGRADRPAAAPVPRGSNEPWSDVPPELEAMLRAQVAQKPAPSRTTAATPPPIDDAGFGVGAVGADVGETVASVPASRPATRKPATRKPAVAKAPAKPRATRKSASASTEAVEAVASADGQTAPEGVAKPAPKPRAARKPASAKADATSESAAGTDATPKRRSRKTATAEPV
jgi:hypothetical protein